MKTNSIVKILIILIIILSIGLIATITKLTAIDKDIINQGTPTVVDKNSENIIERPQELERELKEREVEPSQKDPIEEIEENILDNNIEDKVPDVDKKPPKKDKPFKGKKPKNEKSNNKDKSNKNHKKNNKEDKNNKKDKSKEEKAMVNPKYISTDEAIKIGINKVGDGAELIKIESDLDDNPPKYELEIILGDYEYEIEIHAITGAVIDFEKDEVD